MNTETSYPRSLLFQLCACRRYCRVVLQNYSESFERVLDSLDIVSLRKKTRFMAIHVTPWRSRESSELAAPRTHEAMQGQRPPPKSLNSDPKPALGLRASRALKACLPMQFHCTSPASCVPFLHPKPQTRKAAVRSLR